MAKLCFETDHNTLFRDALYTKNTKNTKKNMN